MSRELDHEARARWRRRLRGVEERADRPPTDVFGQRCGVEPRSSRRRRRDGAREASLDRDEHLLGGHTLVPQAVHVVANSELDPGAVIRRALAGRPQSLEHGSAPDRVGGLARLPDRGPSAFEDFFRAFELLQRSSELRGETGVSIVAAQRVIQASASRRDGGDIAARVTRLVPGGHRRTVHWGTGRYEGANAARLWPKRFAQSGVTVRRSAAAAWAARASPCPTVSSRA